MTHSVTIIESSHATCNTVKVYKIYKNLCPKTEIFKLNCKTSIKQIRGRHSCTYQREMYPHNIHIYIIPSFDMNILSKGSIHITMYIVYNTRLALNPDGFHFKVLNSLAVQV